MTRYNHPALRQLSEQQVRYAPHEVRKEQIERAERLLAEVSADETYAYPDVCAEVTGFRAERYPDLVLPGSDLIHDLRCFIEDLSDSLNLAADSADEPVLTVQDVSERFNVSTKTVDRWRDRGLASRRYWFGSRKRIGFPESSLDRFVKQHPQEISRGSRFSQLTDEEREQILRRARRLARAGANPAEIGRRLSRRFNRSQETIRYTIRNYDENHPEVAVFPDHNAPLTSEQKRLILQQFRRGATVEELAHKYRRTKTSIYRIVGEQRAAQIMNQNIDYMYSEDFESPTADRDFIDAPAPTNPQAKKATIKPPPGLPPYLASLYAIPLLNREQEVYYFRKMNLLKHKAAQLRAQLDPKRPSTRTMNQIEQLLSESQQVKNFLIRSNLRLVVSIAKRHIKPSGNFFEMVSDGNMSLIRAIEKFDYTKGNKFSTYATWAIMKNFARSIPAEHTQLDRFRTGHDELFQASTDQKPNPFQLERENRVQNRLIMRILDHLDDREREIIISRFGLQPQSEPETLEQVGARFGVTKERIRQLESRALRKLKRVASEQKLDIPGL